MIIDDSREDREYLKRLLAKADRTWRFVEAESAETGVSLAREQRFDCIVLDHQLPDGSGMSLLDRLRNDLGQLEVPVLILTGMGDERLAASAIKAGAQDYIPKKELTQHLISHSIYNAVEKFRLIEGCRRLEEKARSDLNEALRQYRFLAEMMPQLVFTARSDGRVVYLNNQSSVYAGMTLESLNTRGWEVAVHPGDTEQCVKIWSDSIKMGLPVEIESRLARQDDGEFRWHLMRALPFRNEQGEIVAWFGTFTDIHAQKTEKERLESEVETRTEQLRRSLREKEVLLQEVHHRVKNNLQVISSLLRMQALSLKDTPASAAFGECQRRVLSMALIYERLYRNDHSERIDFGEYARSLVQELFDSYSHQVGEVSGRINTSGVVLSIDQAIPCGLILNELVTNALKYAYLPDQQGEVLIELKESGANHVQLSVTDHGAGLPQGWDMTQVSSLGLRIVEELATQLDGTLTIRSEHGASFVVEFPKQALTASASAA